VIRKRQIVRIVIICCRFTLEEFAALPPDVRKGSAFPARQEKHFRGYAQHRFGRSPIKEEAPERRSLSAHQAAKPLNPE
jgi:hypothetical protein